MASSGYAPFDRYHDEFRVWVRQMEEFLHSPDGDSADTTSIDLSQQLRECRKLLTPMRLEARGAPDESWTRTLMDIVQACEMQLASYQALSDDRTELFRGHNEETTCKSEAADKSSSNSRDRVKATKGSVARQNAQLANALRSIQETQEVAGSIGKELNSNRKKLKRSQKNVKSMSAMTEQANGMVTKMMKRWF